MNFFDIEKEFFIIDSLNLDKVASRFYGYSIQKTGMLDSQILTQDKVDGLDGRGCYVYVESADDYIKIHQDYNGCYGLYIYNSEDFFAVSNSFLRLVNHIKNIKEISINRDYLNHLIYFPLESESFSFTPINEIELIDRNSIIYIDKKKGRVSIEHIRPTDHKYSIDSEEGIRILDEWFYYWTDIFRELSKSTDFLSIDLSGGYDSRLSFLLMLQSGADMNRIRVYSCDDGLHTHSEDYKIASQIAREYNFALNKSFPANNYINYSLEDVLNIEFYSKLGFHKEPYIQYKKYENKIFHVVGGAGEAIRATRFDKKKQEFLEMMSVAAHVYPTKIAKELSDSFKRLMEKDFEIIHDKYGVADELPYPYGHYLLRDTQCRSHFGKIALVNYFANRFILSPLMDQKLWSLELSCDAVQDNNFLMALIYQRYCPKLLEFPFEGNRYFLSPTTIECAKAINKKYPLKKRSEEFIDFHINSIDKNIGELNIKDDNEMKGDEVTSYLKKMFDSSYVKGIFLTEFDEFFYYIAEKYFHSTKYFPIRHCYSILAATKAIESVLESKRNNNSRTGLFLESKMNHVAKDIYGIIEKNKNNFTARIDIEFFGKFSKDAIQELSVSDDMANIYQPEFLNKNSCGYVVTSYSGDVDIYFKAKYEGRVKVVLHGLDVRVPGDKSKRIAYWVDYTRLAVDGINVLEDTFPSWHDKRYRYVFDVKESGQVHLKVCWKAHQDSLVIDV